jgi:hypothetical protein
MLRREGAKLTLLGTTDARLFEAGKDPVEHKPGADLSPLLKYGV